ncbi:MAG TPA: hypothetical protein PLN25_10205 [Deltaproteobacteria bacterium]|nr:hypothetical protein [Deltaproteobacteria bacterium]HQB38918.1 hypothetical protein [Deltaproteobacteria bacterium]
MLVPISEFSGEEPDVSKCRTEAIITDLYRCLGNHCNCKYGLPAGSTSTYCLHPDFRKFSATNPPLARHGACGAGVKQRA